MRVPGAASFCEAARIGSLHQVRIKPIAPPINRFGGGRQPSPNPRFSFSDAISRALPPFLEVASSSTQPLVPMGTILGTGSVISSLPGAEGDREVGIEDLSRGAAVVRGPRRSGMRSLVGKCVCGGSQGYDRIGSPHRLE